MDGKESDAGGTLAGRQGANGSPPAKQKCLRVCACRGLGWALEKAGHTGTLDSRCEMATDVMNQVDLTSLSKSGWRSSTLSNFTKASGGLVLPFS